MKNDQLRKKLLEYLDDLVAKEGPNFINSKEIAKDFNDNMGVNVEPQRVNNAVEYLIDKGYLDYSDTSSSDTLKGTSDYLVKKVTAEGRDFIEGKSEGGGDVNFTIGDIDADMVAIGQDISQEKTFEVRTLKDIVDRAENISGEDKEELKERLDVLIKELEKPNPDRSIVGNILQQIKSKGPDLLVGLAAKLLFQMFMSAAT